MDLKDAPDGCLACNDEESRKKLQAILDDRKIEVQPIVTPRHNWGDIIVCEKCGQAWLLMPRKEDPKKPTA